MYTECQGRRLGAASGRRLIGAVHAWAVELGLDLLHALLQPLSFRSDYRHRDRARVVGVVVARGVLTIDGPVSPVSGRHTRTVPSAAETSTPLASSDEFRCVKLEVWGFV